MVRFSRQPQADGPIMSAASRVAIVGAGAAGLAMARQLDRAGLESVVFEAERRLGGTWVYDEATESDPLGRAPGRRRIHTSMYAGLHTNLPRDLMAFREFPFDDSTGGRKDMPRFPRHTDVLHYLERYAEHFNLVRRIRFGNRVSSVVPLGESGEAWTDRGDEPTAWQVRSIDAGGSTRNEQFSAVAICNGHYAFPRVPSLPGAEHFEGRQLHSHSYRHPEDYRGERVVLLGARASGIDIAFELGRHAREVHLCARGVKQAAPFFGRENISLHPSIASLESGATAVLDDGSCIEKVDTLLYCTGYEYRLPFLDPEREASPIVAVEDNWIHPLFLDLVAARAATLGLVGLPNSVVPFPQYELQANLLARSLAGYTVLPSRPEREKLADQRATELRTAGVAPRHFLQQGDAQFAYNDELARLGKADCLPASFRRLHAEVEQARFRDPETYRDEEFPPLENDS